MDEAFQLVKTFFSEAHIFITDIQKDLGGSGEEARTDSSLVMNTFGLSSTCEAAQMNEIRHIVLAIVMVAEHAA
jgi:hypothetical protein